MITPICYYSGRPIPITGAHVTRLAASCGTRFLGLVVFSKRKHPAVQDFLFCDKRVKRSDPTVIILQYAITDHIHHLTVISFAGLI